ncbi:hypothetical protein MVEN_00743500 [Mycena venus]|uniref:BTB domain-containing protein n=1 Tax=Mycena venus TaxID=2733690 RepID=A0A8H6YFD3_9AGAR|nr:hypothetical protein MVEN_00743500 [Mycena venus]
MAGALSGHIINSYESSMSNQSICTDGLISFNPHMHGAFNPNMTSTQQALQQSFGFGSLSQASTSMSESTYDRVQRLQAKLNQKLGPEFISQRPGPGGGPKLTYAEGWKVINVANEVFGFEGWSSNIVSLTTDYMDYNEETRRYNVGVSAVMRVTLKEGVFHEDVGYGMIENAKAKGMALDKCKKEAVTDGLKRTLRTFGNVMGNCLYDKQYTSEIVKIKVPPVKFDKGDLYRLPELSEKPPSAALTSASASKSFLGSRSMTATSTPVRAPVPAPAPPQQQKWQPPPQQQPVKPISSVPRHMQPTGLQTPITTPAGERKVSFAPQAGTKWETTRSGSRTTTLSLACVDMGEGDLGQPIDFEEGMGGSTLSGGDEESMQETPAPQPEAKQQQQADDRYGPMGLGRTGQGAARPPAQQQRKGGMDPPPNPNLPQQQRTYVANTIASRSGAPKPPSGGPSRPKDSGNESSSSANPASASGSASRLLAIANASHTSTSNQNQKPLSSGPQDAVGAPTTGTSASTTTSTPPLLPAKRQATPSVGGFHFPPGMPNPLLHNNSRPPPQLAPQGVKRGADAMIGSSTRAGTSAGMGLSGGGGARQPLGTLALDGQNTPQYQYQQGGASDPKRPPDEAAMEGEGCHVVELSDAAEDWESLLEVLYNPFVKQDRPRKFNVLAAMLRLGRKYVFAEAYEDAVSRIHYEFPADFKEFNDLDADMIKIKYRRGIYCDLLNLAYECGVYSSVPLLAFCCLREDRLEKMLEGVQRHDGSYVTLPDDLKITLALAFGRMAFFQHQSLVWLRNDSVIPYRGLESCQSPTRCTQQRNAMARTVDDDHDGVRSKIWMPYGDIILQAESTQFRVNRDILAQQSSVFADMFSVPLPPNEPTVEGCPIVRVTGYCEGLGGAS